VSSSSSYADIYPNLKKELALLDKGLVNTPLSESNYTVYSDGSHDDEKSVILPLMTTPLNDMAHLTIRDARKI
jgi:hypothetical protein